MWLVIVAGVFICKWGIDLAREDMRLRHQSQNTSATNEQRLAALEAEVKALRELVTDAVIELDDRAKYQNLTADPPSRSVDA
jgi:hypothetical protein